MQECWGLPVVGQGSAWQPGPVSPPARSRAAGGHQGNPSPRHRAPPWGQAEAGTWAHGWAQLSGAHGQAGQGCGELETSPAAASLGQGLTAMGG